MKALFLALLLAAPCSAVELVVFHTNDTHGWMMKRPSKDDPKKLVGGAAAYKAVIDREKRPKLVLDGGDWWQGTPEGSLTRGESMAEIFNAVGYDALAVGNHEFDAGWESLKNLVPKLKGAALSANTRDAKTGRRVPWLKPWVIKEVAGVKVGIFGLTTTGMPRLVFAKSIAGLAFRREIDEARDAVAELKKAGADIVIAVTHVGLESEGKPPKEGERALAREVPGIDLIVGGHTHTFLREPWRDPKNGTLVVQAGQYFFSAGKVVLTIDDKTKKVTASEGRLFDLDPAQGEDAAVAAVVDKWVGRTAKEFDVVIATSAARLERGEDHEWPVGSWVADCMHAWGKGDAVLQNGGGVRSILPAGPVTRRHMFEVMPFDNRMAKVRMSGAQLKSAFARGLGAIRIVQVAGIEASYRRPASFERRVVDGTMRVAGAPLDEKKTYAVTTVDYMVQDGDYDEFKDSELHEEMLRDVLTACAKRQGTIVAPKPRLTKVED